MKRRLILLSLALAAGMVTVACSQTVYQEIVTYVNEFLPIAETIANMILATEAPGTVSQAQSIEGQINNDFQLVETTASQITTQNYADKRATILALAADANSQLSAYESALHITNPATLAKVTAFAKLGVAVIDEIVNALPAQNPSAAEVAKVKMKVGAVQVNYKSQFNRLVREKSGDPKVDAVLAKTKLFRHGILRQTY